MADDDPDDHELVRSALKDTLMRVELLTVYDGVQLLDLLSRRYAFRNMVDLPDVIFLDLNMPLMDGFQTLKQIKQNPQFRTIPVYILTTSKSEKEKDRAMQLGATGFYSKGASQSNIKQIVEAICFNSPI